VILEQKLDCSRSAGSAWGLPGYTLL